MTYTQNQVFMDKTGKYKRNLSNSAELNKISNEISKIQWEIKNIKRSRFRFWIGTVFTPLAVSFATGYILYKSHFFSNQATLLKIESFKLDTLKASVAKESFKDSSLKIENKRLIDDLNYKQAVLSKKYSADSTLNEKLRQGNYSRDAFITDLNSKLSTAKIKNDSLAKVIEDLNKNYKLTYDRWVFLQGEDYSKTLLINHLNGENQSLKEKLGLPK